MNGAISTGKTNKNTRLRLVFPLVSSSGSNDVIHVSRLLSYFVVVEKNTNILPRQISLHNWMPYPTASKILHLLLFITRKYTIINAHLKVINTKIHSFYSIDIH